MEKKMTFNYFYGTEADLFTVRTPKIIKRIYPMGNTRCSGSI